MNSANSDILNDIVNKIASITGFSAIPILLTIYTIANIILIKLFYELLTYINSKIIKDERKLYIFNKKLQVIKYIFYVLAVIVIWKTQIKSVITFISFIAAAITLALKDIITNFFAGIYISLYKPFKVEDRIEITHNSRNIIGDVVNINSLNFELLEISDNENSEQSTGIIVAVPNEIIFTNALKNYTKAFKYIWNEIEVPIEINKDLEKNKQVLYDIVNSNDIVKSIPTKMKKELNKAALNYRIYYNNLKPIIYTKLDKDSLILTIRYLVHPRKARNTRSEIWNAIYEKNKNKELDLFIKK